MVQVQATQAEAIEAEILNQKRETEKIRRKITKIKKVSQVQGAKLQNVVKEVEADINYKFTANGDPIVIRK